MESVSPVRPPEWKEETTFDVAGPWHSLYPLRLQLNLEVLRVKNGEE